MAVLMGGNSGKSVRIAAGVYIKNYAGRAEELQEDVKSTERISA